MIAHLEPDILECEVRWALESITRNKASGGDVNPVELFQILKHDALKVLHSISQQIWKIQQWATGLEKVSFHSSPKKGNEAQSLYSHYAGSFYHTWMLNLTSAFSASIERIHDFYLQFVNMVYHIVSHSVMSDSLRLHGL